MYERHENEQYFFDADTLEHLVEFVRGWDSPCVLCAPLLGKRLAEAGVAVSILDIDERFAGVPGFQHFDLYRPKWTGRRFGLILCDPPFFNVSLSQLFAAIRLLSQNDFQQPLLVSYLGRRSSAIVGAFSRFDLRPSGYFPTYQTVQPSPRNEIEFFSNLSNEPLQRLSGEVESDRVGQ